MHRGMNIGVLIIPTVLYRSLAILCVLLCFQCRHLENKLMFFNYSEPCLGQSNQRLSKNFTRLKYIGTI